MIYFTLFVRFFLTGLMAVGGGLATLPFLQEIGRDTGWFTSMDLANMIAISESTPGPMGVNMATYVGYHVGSEHYGIFGGILGGVVATLSLVLPSLIVILIVVKVLDAFKESKLVQAVFRGLRPASMAMIAAAGLSVAKVTLINTEAAGIGEFFCIPQIICFIALFFAMKKWKLHPIAYICIAAAVGVVLAL